MDTQHTRVESFEPCSFVQQLFDPTGTAVTRRARRAGAPCSRSYLRLQPHLCSRDIAILPCMAYLLWGWTEVDEDETNNFADDFSSLPGRCVSLRRIRAFIPNHQYRIYQPVVCLGKISKYKPSGSYGGFCNLRYLCTFCTKRYLELEVLRHPCFSMMCRSSYSSYYYFLHAHGRYRSYM